MTLEPLRSLSGRFAPREELDPIAGRMNIEPTIVLDHVSKQFRFSTDEADSILDVIISTVRRRPRQHKQILWAVKDVSFAVNPGESIALVGLNGSGKSTILKLAAGIIRPSSGQIAVRGRLSALLELGAGFHSDLTGQENIWLNASILGLTNAEIAEIYDDIVEFSELREFINMPVKHYSSGMYMRLGFSVAVHIDPDVVLIDEILAVGDQTFQDKCLDRLRKLKEAGTTIVFVSHNPAMVLSLCERAIWIKDGQLIADGPSKEVVGKYLANQGASLDDEVLVEAIKRSASGEVELQAMRLYDVDGYRQDEYAMGEGMIIEIDYLAKRPVKCTSFDLTFQHEDGTYVGGPSALESDLGEVLEAGPGTVRCRIGSLPLSPAAYHISASVYDGADSVVFDHRERLTTFRIVGNQEAGRTGLLRIPASWEMTSPPTGLSPNEPAAPSPLNVGSEADEKSSRARS